MPKEFYEKNAKMFDTINNIMHVVKTLYSRLIKSEKYVEGA